MTQASDRGWKAFLSAYNIPFKRSNGNNIELRCPLCTDDHSTNLGLSTVHSGWKCWRNSSHRGRKPAPVISALLGVTTEEAISISEHYFDGFYDWTPADRKDPEWVKPLEDFKEFTFNSKNERPYLDYLKERGFDPLYAVRRFNLRYAPTGDYYKRLIIPIIEDKQWYSWVARTVDKNNPIRYKAARSKDTDTKKAGAKSEPSNHLFDFDNLRGGRSLVVVEGTLDSMFITSQSIPATHSTATCGKELSGTQISNLVRLSKRYDRIILGYDKDAYYHAMKLKSELDWYITNLEAVFSPYKDWNVTPRREIISLLTGGSDLV